MYTEIYCKCCNQSAKIEGTHEFVRISACANQVCLEGRPGSDGGSGFPQIRAKNYQLLLVRHSVGAKYEPLMQEEKPKKAKPKKPEPAPEKRPVRRRRKATEA